MGKKSSLSQVHCAEFVTLYKEGYSNRKISAKCDVNKTAVHIAIVNWRLRTNYGNLKRSGRTKNHCERPSINEKDGCTIPN